MVARSAQQNKGGGRRPEDICGAECAAALIPPMLCPLGLRSPFMQHGEKLAPWNRVRPNRMRHRLRVTFGKNIDLTHRQRLAKLDQLAHPDDVAAG